MTATQNIGNNVERARTAAGVSRDDIAVAARECGLPWGRSTVNAIEAGTKDLNVADLLLLPLVLLRATGGTCDMTLWELLTVPGEDVVELTPETSIGYGELSKLLEGAGPSQLNLDGVNMPLTRSRRRLQGEALERAKELRRVLWPGVSLGRITSARMDGDREAEQKAAHNLGLPADAVAVAAHRRWGHGLTVERDERVGKDGPPRTIQARRGHVTRQLLAELEPLLEPLKKEQ